MGLEFWHEYSFSFEGSVFVEKIGECGNVIVDKVIKLKHLIEKVDNG